MPHNFQLVLLISILPGQVDPTAKEGEQDRKLDKKISVNAEFHGTLGDFLTYLAKTRDLSFLVQITEFEEMWHKDILGVHMAVSPRKEITLREYLEAVLKTVDAQCRAGKGFIEIIPIHAEADKEAYPSLSSASNHQHLNARSCRPLERRIGFFRRIH